jgi:hypothetical protein
VAQAVAEGKPVEWKDILLALHRPMEVVRLTFIWILQRIGPEPRAVAIASTAALVAIVSLRALGLDALFWIPSTRILPDEVLNLPGVRSAASIEDTKLLRRCVVRAREIGQK